MIRVSAHNVDPNAIEDRLLELSRGRSFFSLYTSGRYANSFKQHELLFGIDALEVHVADDLESGAFEKGWKFGYLGYELRHRFETLEKGNPKLGCWPEAMFFTPEVVGGVDLENTLWVEAQTHELATYWLEEIQSKSSLTAQSLDLDFVPLESRASYIRAVEEIQRHIQRGDFYEMNYCTAFEADFKQVSTPEVMKHLRTKTEAPFSGYLKLDQHELLCFSPERYLLKKDAVILSQPIKGTSAKSTNNVGQLRALQQNEKERAENVMIVDLVRNDLSRVASKGSVSVTELFGAYEFKSVNQLISTVRAELREGISNWDIIKASFPMGSMTGAPKVSAMMHAERYEKSAREIYSGAMGYVAPNGDFDLNVVIRSIALSHLTQKAVVHVGGAITILSDPSEEYKECLLKAEAIIPTSS